MILMVTILGNFRFIEIFDLKNSRLKYYRERAAAETQNRNFSQDEKLENMKQTQNQNWVPKVMQNFRTHSKVRNKFEADCQELGFRVSLKQNFDLSR